MINRITDRPLLSLLLLTMMLACSPAQLSVNAASAPPHFDDPPLPPDRDHIINQSAVRATLHLIPPRTAISTLYRNTPSSFSSSILARSLDSSSSSPNDPYHQSFPHSQQSAAPPEQSELLQGESYLIAQDAPETEMMEDHLRPSHVTTNSKSSLSSSLSSASSSSPITVSSQSQLNSQLTIPSTSSQPFPSNIKHSATSQTHSKTAPTLKTRASSSVTRPTGLVDRNISETSLNKVHSNIPESQHTDALVHAPSLNTTKQKVSQAKVTPTSLKSLDTSRKSDSNKKSAKKQNALVDSKTLLGLEKLFMKNAGIRRRPPYNPEFAVPEYMLDLYQRQVETKRRGSNTYAKVKGTGPVAANTVRSFTHSDVETASCVPPHCSHIHFDVLTIPEYESLTGAELRVYVAPLHQGNQSSGGDGSVNANRNAARGNDATAAQSALAKASPSVNVSPVRLEIHQIIKPAQSGSTEAITRLLDTKSVDVTNHAAWHSFDIAPAVSRWKRLGPPHNHGLEVRLVPKSRKGQSNKSDSSGLAATHKHLRVRRSPDVHVRDWALTRPLLVAYTDDGLNPKPSLSASRRRGGKTTLLRRRRSADGKKEGGKDKNNNDRKKRKRKRKNRRRNKRKRKRKKKKNRRTKKGNKNLCKRHSLYVDFSDVGWDDWIVAPPAYNAYFCHGECNAPIPAYAKASNHAMLQARVYKVDPKAVPMVCCVPIRMSPISMLYRDENGRTVLKNYNDMSVDECGCK